MTRITSRFTRLALVLGLFGALLVGCSDSDPTSDPVDRPETGRGSSSSTEAPSGENETQKTDPLGFRITAEPDTQLTVEIVPFSNGQEQQTLTQKVEVTDDPWSLLFTVFIHEANLTVTLESGTEATFETIRGHLVDENDPFGPIEVTEVLDTVSIAGSEPVVITMP